jgi:hypothetical protein
MVTSYPALAHAAHKWTPIRPVPPITETVGSSLDGRSAGLGAHGPIEDFVVDAAAASDVAIFAAHHMNVTEMNAVVAFLLWSMLKLITTDRGFMTTTIIVTFDFSVNKKSFDQNGGNSCRRFLSLLTHRELSDPIRDWLIYEYMEAELLSFVSA